MQRADQIDVALSSRCGGREECGQRARNARVPSATADGPPANLVVESASASTHHSDVCGLREEPIALPSDVLALGAQAPVPAVIGRISTGTAGWTDKTLIQCGRFYTRVSLSANERLRFYAAHFRMVELDATYYALLAPSAAERWVQETPDGFRMSVKAFAPLTGHSVDVARLPTDLRDAMRSRFRATRVRASEIPVELLGE